MENRVERLNRRQFLVRLGATSAAITVVGAGVSALLNTTGKDAPSVALLPNATEEARDAADRSFPNSGDSVEPAAGTRPEFTPVADHYRIDIAAIPPAINGETWRLPITGLVDNPIELTLDDIRNNFDPVYQYITMSCISNPVGGDLISTQLWTGASFRDVLAQAQPKSEATHVKITSADGFDETVALDIINNDPEVTLNYDWDGQPLPVRNGFPLRTHIPNRFGMKQPKWITGMELVAGDQDGFWVRRGWSKDALIRATSVIDTVAMDMMVIEDGVERRIVPVGGIAFAGPRGVSRVEVQVDDGEWQEAELRAPLNNNLDAYKTWRIWRFNWEYQAGAHTFTVRMYEEDGTPQIEDVNGVRPDGATGYHSHRSTL